MNYEDIIKETAKKFRTTPEEIEKGIREAIDAAYANPTPEVRENQSKIPCKGERPTPEEFITGVAELVSEKRE